MKMFRYIVSHIKWPLILITALIFCACEDWCGRNTVKESDDVLLLYSAGYNSLSSFLKGDFNDLKKGYVPEQEDGGDVLLAYMHVKNTDSPGPVLMRLYKSKHNLVVADTLVVYPEGSISATAGQLKNVLTYVKDNFPAKSYGMIFSSHATGWLPSGYYANSDDYESGEFVPVRRFSSSDQAAPVPYKEPEYDPAHPLTKSIGQDVVPGESGSLSYEIELGAFADAIPMHMDYILFDACLMGGVEVAYELREVCDKVGFSQAEVLAEGFDYTTLTNHLFLSEEPLPEKVCEDYFDYYDALTGIEHSATVSCIDCSGLDALAQVCRTLFSKYSAQIETLDPAGVQRYYRSDYHWFYDLESILVKAGIDADELAQLHSALDACVIYKAATPSFMGSFDIRTFSGFSMFLPSDGGKRLKEYYKTLDWNKATSLVR